MKTRYILLLLFVFLASLSALAWSVNESQRKASSTLARALDSLKTLSDERNPNTVSNTDPEITEQTLSRNLDQARTELNRVAAEVSQIKGTVAGQIQNLDSALSSVQQARNVIENLQTSSDLMLEANMSLIAQISNVQSRYDRKIADLESRLSEIQTSSVTHYGLEFYAGLAGLITAISTLLLGWRKDNREAATLKAQLVEQQRES